MAYLVFSSALLSCSNMDQYDVVWDCNCEEFRNIAVYQAMTDPDGLLFDFL